MRYCYWMAACALASGFGIGLASGQETGCPGSPGYGDPVPTVIDGPTSTDYGYGDPNRNEATSEIQHLPLPEDPGLVVTDYQRAGEEFTWTMIAPTGCNYNVTYWFKGSLNGISQADCRFSGTDGDPNDSDHAKAQGLSQIKNDGAGPWHTLPTSAEANLDEQGVVDSQGTPSHPTPTAMKSCVGVGTKFSCSCRAQVALAKTVSQARASVLHLYGDPLFWHQEVLCQ